MRTGHDLMALESAAAIDYDFRPQATYWLALAALTLVVPFTINNLLQERFGVAISALSIVAILVLNAWSHRLGERRSTAAPVALAAAIVVFLAVSLRTQGIIGLLWCYPAIPTMYCLLSERQAWAANAALLGTVIPVLLVTIETPIALRGAATLLGVTMFTAILVHVITRQQTQLRHKVVTDPLTGLLNRHALLPALARSVAQNAALGTPMTLLVLDLDHFKRINDNHGHEAGDTVLSEVGALLRRRVRVGDSAFRLGGEEFLVLLHGADEADAARLAEELRRAIRDTELLAGHVVTASLGFATLDGTDEREWLRRADSALYHAKAGGRDRVVGDRIRG